MRTTEGVDHPDGVHRAAGSGSDKPPVFRGWWIAFGGMAALAMAYSLQFSWGLLLPAIEADTGWSRAAISAPFSAYVLAYSLLGVIAGVLTDRLGPRRIIGVGAVMLGTGWALIGLVQELWQLWILFGAVVSLGMASTWVPANATVVRWFFERRGLAIGISSSGASVGNFVGPWAVSAGIGAYGWRPTVVSGGVLIGLVVFGVSRLMIRSPEAVGLHPDGADHPPAETDVGEGLDLSAALRTSSLWLMALMFGLSWVAVFVPFVHLAPYARDLGISVAGSAALISAIGITGGLGRFAIGQLSDRTGRRPMLALMFLLQAAAFIALTRSSTLAPLIASALLFGLGYGGGVAIYPAIIGDFFGRAHVGAIVGFLFAAAGSFSAIGPTVAGWIYDSTGSYRTAFLLAAAGNVGALAIVAILRRPTQPTTPSS